MAPFTPAGCCCEESPAADHQWRFSCTIHNLLKLHRNRGLAAITAT